MSIDVFLGRVAYYFLHFPRFWGKLPYSKPFCESKFDRIFSDHVVRYRLYKVGLSVGFDFNFCQRGYLLGEELYPPDFTG